MKIPEFLSNTSVPRETISQAPARSRLDAREYAEKIRRERVSISSVIKRLPDFGDNPGWKRRWVNDEGVPMRRNEGYRFVTKDEIGDVAYDAMRNETDPSNFVCRPVGGLNDENKLRMAYLMEIPIEIADELDYEKSHKAIKASESAIRSGSIGNAQQAGHSRQPDGVVNSISTKS